MLLCFCVICLRFVKLINKEITYLLTYFTFNEAPLEVNIGANSLNFAQALLTMAIDASPAPPSPAPMTSPK